MPRQIAPLVCSRCSQTFTQSTLPVYRSPQLYRQLRTPVINYQDRVVPREALPTLLSEAAVEEKIVYSMLQLEGAM